jgi:heterodisulfide reductase subunit A-like polyferredoxin
MNMAQEHPSSYYAATVNEVTGYPQLEDHVRSDVCVIGGGFTGISAALALAERGYKVCVLEANKIGWGASGRNGGQMTSSGKWAGAGTTLSASASSAIASTAT